MTASVPDRPVLVRCDPVLVLSLGSILIVAFEDDTSVWLLLTLLLYVPLGYLSFREKRPFRE